jgi:hypothetical protein
MQATAVRWHQFAMMVGTPWKPPLKAIELVGDIDDQHRLHAQTQKELPAGQVRLIVLLPEEDEAGGVWAHGIANE